ncbi:hypothetical protein ACHQM5_004160 [Ranunculus cassubicifolius]
MTTLWDELAVTESTELRVFAPYVTRREEQRLVQFLMALRDDFEGLRGSILHRSPLPSVVSELLAEEIRFKSQAMKAHVSVPSSSVLAMPYRPSSTSQHKPPAIPNDCHYCKESGHWMNNCPSLLRKKQQWEGKSKYLAKWES